MTATSTRDPSGWFLTYTGRQYWPCDPRPEDVSILDIAHHLSNICRFGGACSPFYSVAQHSVITSQLARKYPRLALMHDATEAYVGDIVRPLKYSPQFAFYFDIEALNWKAIATTFGFSQKDPKDEEEVAVVDDIALMTERRDLMIKSSHRWSVRAKPDPKHIDPLPPADAEKLFLDRFIELWGEKEFRLFI